MKLGTIKMIMGMLIISIAVVLWEIVAGFRTEEKIAVYQHPVATAVSISATAGPTAVVFTDEKPKPTIPERFSLVGHWHLKEGFGAGSPNHAISVDYYFDESDMTEVSSMPHGADIHMDKDSYVLSASDMKKGLMKLETNGDEMALQYPKGKERIIRCSDMKNGAMDLSKSRTMVYVDTETEPQD
jgi:hypothetical protein